MGFPPRSLPTVFFFTTAVFPAPYRLCQPSRHDYLLRLLHLARSEPAITSRFTEKFGFPVRSDFFDSWCHLLCVAPDVGSLPFFTPAFISAVCCRSLHVVILAGVVTLVSPSPLHLLTHGSTPDSTPGDLQPHKYPGHPSRD